MFPLKSKNVLLGIVLASFNKAYGREKMRRLLHSSKLWGLINHVLLDIHNRWGSSIRPGQNQSNLKSLIWISGPTQPLFPSQIRFKLKFKLLWISKGLIAASCDSEVFSSISFPNLMEEENGFQDPQWEAGIYFINFHLFLRKNHLPLFQTICKPEAISKIHLPSISIYLQQFFRLVKCCK